MNTITEHRHALADALTATGQLQGHPTPPERVVPPCAVITEGRPLLEAVAGTWGHRLRLAVRLVVPPATNSAMTEQLDALVAAAVAILEGHPEHDYDVPTVGPYEQLEANGATYLSTELVATTLVPQLTTTTD